MGRQISPMYPVKNSKIFAGTSELVQSEKYAIPFGNDNTPAPTIFFARLNVEIGTDALFDDIDPGASAAISSAVLLKLLCG